jgi:hypothetical protein
MTTHTISLDPAIGPFAEPSRERACDDVRRPPDRSVQNQRSTPLPETRSRRLRLPILAALNRAMHTWSYVFTGMAQ